MFFWKAWLETRWRLTASLIMPAAVICAAAGSRQPSVNPVTGVAWLMLFSPMFLAGCGVTPQAPIGFPEGLAGSVYFTLSLPVSRLRLFAVRATVGFLEMVGLVLLFACLTWLLFPSVHNNTSLFDLAKFVFAGIALLAVLYFATTFFTVFVPDPFPGMATILLIAGMLIVSNHLPEAANIFLLCRTDLPLRTHNLVWSQVGVASALAMLLIAGAAVIVRTREC
jgi:hypothetical protein